MNVERADVVVIGAGVNGLAVARAIASGGRRVIVLEQHEVGTPRASSHGTSRIFRLSHDQPEEVSQARQALELWRALEREVDVEILSLGGSLDTGRELDSHRAALEAEDVSYALLSAEEVAHRFPVRLAPGDEALLQPDGGIVRADRALGALRRSAERHGAETREGVRVSSLDVGPDGVTITCDHGRLDAAAVAVAAGAWAPHLLRDTGVALAATPTRETITYFSTGGAPVPSLIDWAERPTARARRPLALYGLHAPGVGLKVGVHHSGPVSDPDADGAPDPEIVRIASAWVADRFPTASPDPVRTETCLYTSNPGLVPVVETHGRIAVVSACNGHGFKFAPAVGARVADMVEAALAS